MGKKLFSRLAQFSPKILANLTQIYSYLAKLGKSMHQINFDFPAIFVKFKATSYEKFLSHLTGLSANSDVCVRYLSNKSGCDEGRAARLTYAFLGLLPDLHK